MLRSTKSKVASALAALALVVTALFAGFGSSAATAAVDNPALTGTRVQCVDQNGFIRILNAPCSQYKGMWFLGPVYLGPTATTTPVDATPAVKRETNVTVNVDFDSTKPITVTGLPAFRAGSPELWGDNTGSIADAAADIVVKRLATSATACPSATPATFAPPADPSLDVYRAVGSTVQKFCAYPRHLSTTTVTPGTTTPTPWYPGFLAGQSYKLNVWVYAP